MHGPGRLCNGREGKRTTEAEEYLCEVYFRLNVGDPFFRIAGCLRVMLTPGDMFEIQSAIDRYERAFPRKPSPSPATALAWVSGQRTTVLPGECGLLSWLWESFLVWWQLSTIPRMGAIN